MKRQKRSEPARAGKRKAKVRAGESKARAKSEKAATASARARVWQWGAAPPWGDGDSERDPVNPLPRLRAKVPLLA